jgi:hypothetical protein
LLKNWPKSSRFFRIKKCTSLDICSLDSRVDFRIITMCGGENMDIPELERPCQQPMM